MKFFDIDDVDNSENERVLGISCSDADEKGGVMQKQNLSQKVLMWLDACSKNVATSW